MYLKSNKKKSLGSERGDHGSIWYVAMKVEV